MRTDLPGYYSIFLGVSVVGMWIIILLTEAIPEGKTALSFHLVSEFLMAMVCIVGGLFQLKRWKRARMISLLGYGMVLYSVQNAAGYYAERGEMLFVLLFALIFIVTAIAVFFQFKDAGKSKGSATRGQ